MTTFFQKKIGSIKNAFRGISIAWQEKNFRFKIVISALVMLVALVVDFSRIEFAILMIILGVVLSVEVVNTSLEELCDKLEPTPDLRIGRVKDLSAAAVLVSSLAAIVVGLMLFIPHLISF